MTLPLHPTRTDLTHLEHFTTPLRVPGNDARFGLVTVDAEHPVTLVACRMPLEVHPGELADQLVYQATQDGRVTFNPVLRVRSGTSFDARLVNDLDADTTIHWHGLHVPEVADGTHLYPVAPGEQERYHFPVLNRAGMYWYHPHAHGSTAQQVYEGLAGLLFVEDDAELALRAALDLQLGITDIPLIVQDRRIDENASMAYAPDPISAVMGYEGETILVNQTPKPVLTVATRLYRFRMLNGANTRIFRLAFVIVPHEAEMPFTLIGTDAGLLELPITVHELFLAPGERIDLLLDLRNIPVGTTIGLVSLDFDPMHHGMRPGGMQAHNATMTGLAPHGMAAPSPRSPNGTYQPSTLGSGTAFPILRLDVTQSAPYHRTIPAQLSSMELLNTVGVPERVLTLSLEAAMHEGRMNMRWMINGQSLDQDRDAFTVRRGSTEVWTFANAEQSMPHPMHLHGFSFQVLSRRGSPSQVSALTIDEDGRTATDLGWKDTVLIWPGETVRVGVRFAHPFPDAQRYMIHCHMLEHEDSGMMIHFKIE